MTARGKGRQLIKRSAGRGETRRGNELSLLQAQEHDGHLSKWEHSCKCPSQP